VISPLLANIYLHTLGKALTSRGYRVVRYADDLVILCESANKAKNAPGVAQADR
jgi:RNA-directed DNA polymerase